MISARNPKSYQQRFCTIYDPVNKSEIRGRTYRSSCWRKCPESSQGVL